MSLAMSAPAAWIGTLPWVVVAVAVAGYGVAMLPAAARPVWSAPALIVGWLAHLGVLLLDVGGWGLDAPGAHLGFAPVLSMTVWLVIAVHTVESRLVPLPAVRRLLALAGMVAVVLAWVFPGEARPMSSPWAPLHFVLGVGSYGLFGAAVLHAAMLDPAERRLRLQRGQAPASFGMPLLQLERLTFRFVEAGFAVLTATLLLGTLTTARWTWDHKTVFSLLGWAVFAALLLGRRLRGWRGRRATRWLYAGAVLLLLAYAGSRFVVEVLLPR
jgi:ABC-type uncharacterized transport system permease subunit